MGVKRDWVLGCEEYCVVVLSATVVHRCELRG